VQQRSYRLDLVCSPSRLHQAGLDYSLNWSLNKNGVTPSGDAFRLTKASDAAKVGTVSVVSAKATPPAEAGEGALSFGAFEAALDAAKAALSAVSLLRPRGKRRGREREM